MKFDDMYSIVKELVFDKEYTVFSRDDYRLFILRPSEVSKRFKNYDPKRNFQIWLAEGKDEPFMPNHLRVFIDLSLRVRSKPDTKKELLLAFDDIFYGVDPDIALKNLSNVHFEHYLNSLPIIGHLSQLFIIEQLHGYTSSRDSKYDPPTLFYQGWVRTFLDGPREIDQLCMSASSRQPPSPSYTRMDDKNRIEYKKNPPKLWYLGIDNKLNRYLD